MILNKLFKKKINPRIKGLSDEIESFKQHQSKSVKWYSFYPKWSMMKLEFRSNGYFDERPSLIFTLTTMIGFLGLILSTLFGAGLWSMLFLIPFFASWGDVYLNIPFHSGRSQECESIDYGFYVYSHEAWTPMSWVWCIGTKKYHWDFPWTFDWVRTSKLLKDETWAHQTKKNPIDWYDGTWKDQLWRKEYPYTYQYGEVTQHLTATVEVTEREWRRKWIKWLPIGKTISKDIDVSFNEEVGPSRGSWKGGTTGCGYSMKPNETPLDTLRRMERERIFGR